MPPVVTMNSTVVATKEVLESELDSEVVLLYPKSGEYYSLNSVGSWIWNRIREPMSVAELHRAVRDKFEIDSARCEADVVALLNDLATEGLIDLRDAATT